MRITVFLILFILSLNNGSSQIGPDIFTIQGIGDPPGIEGFLTGTYIRSNFVSQDFNGCSCYEKQGEDILLWKNQQDYWVAASGEEKCEDYLTAINIIGPGFGTGVSCDITDIDFIDSLDSGGLIDLSGLYIIVGPIPSLSQWGILTLSILTMIIGVVSIKKSKTLLVYKISGPRR